MHISKISFNLPPVKPQKTETIVRTTTRDENRFIKDAKELEKNIFLGGSKRNIVANLGKCGIISEQPYWIYEEGQDVTPKTMEDYLFPSTKVQGENSKVSFSNIKFKVKTLGRTSSTSASSAMPEGRSISIVSSKITVKRSAFNFSESSNISFGSLIFQLPSFNQESFTSKSKDEESNKFLETGTLAPSMFCMRIEPPAINLQPKATFTVNLTETETNFMLEIPSTAESLESEEGKLISELNSLYERRLLTTKAVSQVATQTDSTFSINKKVYMQRNKRRNASTFVTAWEMYDTYNAFGRLSEATIQSLREQGQVAFLAEELEKPAYNKDFKYLGVSFSNQILVALMVMERLIINDLCRESHLTYNGLLVQDPLSLEVRYKYSLKHLWTFYSKTIVGKRAVTSFSWNKGNSNILAVGYGKFYYKDNFKGLVCLWNVKNPHHPERHYEFESPVTFLTFHPNKHQILAVTFYDGSVFLIDIISWDLLIKASNQHYPHYSPVWQAHWFPTTIKSDRNRGQDHILLTCGKNGYLYRYRNDKFFASRKIMTIGKVHGQIQGVEMHKPCYAKKTLTLKSPSVEVLVPQPSDKLKYVVGTSDGCVHICSILHRYICSTVIQAHTGPVYNISFNPFCNMIFLTCGSDGCIRIWVEGLNEPLVTLQSGLVPIQDAVWSPLHSTVILGATGKQVEIWDLRRCIQTPKSSMVSPSADFNTKLCFTTNGYNVCIGDIEGNVHVMAMSEMPFSPVYQEDILVQALKSVLAPQPDLLCKLERLGKPFFSSKTSNFKAKMDRKLFQLVKSRRNSIAKGENNSQ